MEVEQYAEIFEQIPNEIHHGAFGGKYEGHEHESHNGRDSHDLHRSIDQSASTETENNSVPNPASIPSNTTISKPIAEPMSPANEEVDGESMEIMSDSVSYDEPQKAAPNNRLKPKTESYHKPNSSASGELEGEDMDIMSKSESSTEEDTKDTPKCTNTTNSAKVDDLAPTNNGHDNWVPLQPPTPGDQVNVTHTTPKEPAQDQPTSAPTTTTTSTDAQITPTDAQEIGQALQRRKSIIYVRENWDAKTERLRKRSPFGHFPNWRT